MINLKDCDLREISPLTLAFLGDGVFDLLVRERFVCGHKYPVGVLNEMKVSKVCCQAQSEAAKRIMPFLTDEEINIYKRGRNAKVSGIPKNASVSEYHSATGLEALFGYLYLKGEKNRLNEIFELCMKEDK